MAEENDAAKTALEAVRCLYLARVLRREGHEAAAQRWEARALAWTRRSEPDSVELHVDVDEGPELEEVT